MGHPHIKYEDLFPLFKKLCQGAEHHKRLYTHANVYKPSQMHRFLLSSKPIKTLNFTLSSIKTQTCRIFSINTFPFPTLNLGCMELPEKFGFAVLLATCCHGQGFRLLPPSPEREVPTLSG